MHSHEINEIQINSINFPLSINIKISVISTLSKQKSEEQNNASKALLLLIINTLRYLSQMQLSIRDHSNNDSNFLSLLKICKCSILKILDTTEK